MNFTTRHSATLGSIDPQSHNIGTQDPAKRGRHGSFRLVSERHDLPASQDHHNVSAAGRPRQWRLRWSRLLRGHRRAESAQRQRVAVLPFQNLERQAPGPSYGVALADAVAARLSQESSLMVLSASISRSHVAESCQRLGVSHLVQGSFLRTERGFTISWQLMLVSPPAVMSGATLSVNSFDLVGIRKAICDALLSALHPRTGVTAIISR